MYGIFIFVLYQLTVSLINMFFIRKPDKNYLAYGLKVSILVPARNEEEKIQGCVESLLKQDYKNIEIIVLDDNSSDETFNLLKSFQDNRLKIIKSDEEPPLGWMGKNWACYRLYIASSGDILIFVDADTYLSSDAVSTMVGTMQSNNLDFITGIPREEVYTFGEKITVPFMNFSVLSIFPVFLGLISKYFYFFLFGNGQYMMFKRESYEKIHGHESVKGEVVEDIALSKEAKKNGLKVGIFNLSGLVSCRMYKNFKEAFFGFSKSYTALFDFRLIPSLFVWAWMIVITIFPIFNAILSKDSSIRFFSIASIFVTLLVWMITSIKFNLPKIILILSPLITLVNSLIGFVSMFLLLTGRSLWKGRVVEKKKFKLLIF